MSKEITQPIHDAAAIAALRILVSQAPPGQLSLPAYQDALTIIARADGIRLIDDAGFDEQSLQELIQHIVLLCIEVTWRGLANAHCHYSAHVDGFSLDVYAVDQRYRESEKRHYLHAFNLYELQERPDAARVKLIVAITFLENLLRNGKPVTVADTESAAVLA